MYLSGVPFRIYPPPSNWNKKKKSKWWLKAPYDICCLLISPEVSLSRVDSGVQQCQFLLFPPTLLSTLAFHTCTYCLTTAKWLPHVQVYILNPPPKKLFCSPVPLYLGGKTFPWGPSRHPVTHWANQEHVRPWPITGKREWDYCDWVNEILIHSLDQENSDFWKQRWKLLNG